MQRIYDPHCIVYAMSYKKSCNFCKNEILMTEKLGKWFPLNLDNSPHKCEQEKKPQLKNQLESTILLQQLYERVKRLEKIVIDPRK